jgi:hypothetical protein
LCVISLKNYPWWTLGPAFSFSLKLLFSAASNTQYNWNFFTKHNYINLSLKLFFSTVSDAQLNWISWYFNTLCENLALVWSYFSAQFQRLNTLETFSLSITYIKSFSLKLLFITVSNEQLNLNFWNFSWTLCKKFSFSLKLLFSAASNTPYNWHFFH